MSSSSLALALSSGACYAIGYSNGKIDGAASVPDVSVDISSIETVTINAVGADPVLSWTGAGVAGEDVLGSNDVGIKVLSSAGVEKFSEDVISRGTGTNTATLTGVTVSADDILVMFNDGDTPGEICFGATAIGQMSITS